MRGRRCLQRGGVVVGRPLCSDEYFGRHFERRRPLDEALLATQGVGGDVISGRTALERGL